MPRTISREVSPSRRPFTLFTRCSANRESCIIEQQKSYSFSSFSPRSRNKSFPGRWLTANLFEIKFGFNLIRQRQTQRERERKSKKEESENESGRHIRSGGRSLFPSGREEFFRAGRCTRATSTANIGFRASQRAARPGRFFPPGSLIKRKLLAASCHRMLEREREREGVWPGWGGKKFQSECAKSNHVRRSSSGSRESAAWQTGSVST